MREASPTFIFRLSALLFLCLHESRCSSFSSIAGSELHSVDNGRLLSSDISPSVDPQPLLPLLAPSPLMPYKKNSVPKLSGLCTLNFSTSEILSTTATDCWDSFAPYVSNAICCPQFNAVLTILIGQSSKFSGEFILNSTQAKHCLSDIEQILQAQGAMINLRNMCSMYPSNLTYGSCPVINANEIDRIVNSPRLVDACGKFDVVNECCTQICQKAIADAAGVMSLKSYGNSSSGGARVMSKHLTTIDDCKGVILRWLATKLDTRTMNGVLRGIASCSINKVCPLILPDITNVTKNCGNNISNQTACCNAMESYMSPLQRQSLITNLQALNCAELLSITLQNANISQNVYKLCKIKLKDFTLQVSPQGSGCLLPSLPSDVTYDKTYGISFVCDLNDNVSAPWPSTSFSPASSCNKTTMLPALPKATSAGSGLAVDWLILPLIIAFLELLV